MTSVVMGVEFFFFFSSRRRHTRLQGDWSSDVCSSDLPHRPRAACRWPRHRGHGPARAGALPGALQWRSEENTSELQSPCNLVCRLLLEKNNRTSFPYLQPIGSPVSHNL